VEFIAEQDGRFYFMEMNTRLQVEHPVTEMINGLDRVELQIGVAAGERLPFTQDGVRASGHAVEVRIYAEDPERDFLPSIGKLVHLRFPEGARVDTGVAEGDEISPWYDPMIAKLIVHGATRAAALSRMAAALRDTYIVGPATNVEFLRRICESNAFSGGEIDTGLIERHRAELLRPRGAVPAEVLAAAAAAELAHEEKTARERAARSGDPHSPWHQVDGWRLNEASHHDFVFVAAGEEHRVRVDFAGGNVAASMAHVVRDGRNWHVFHDGTRWTLTLKDDLPDVDVEAAGSLAAPMPGRVVKLMVKAGTRVAKGQPLLILEAMKMEHTIAAPADGTVKEILYREGDQVLEGAELLRVE
jgi:3-methylcrotonyl-CoA carboxylase alpha subunit